MRVCRQKSARWVTMIFLCVHIKSTNNENENLKFSTKIFLPFPSHSLALLRKITFDTNNCVIIATGENELKFSFNKIYAFRMRLWNFQLFSFFSPFSSVFIVNNCWKIQMIYESHFLGISMLNSSSSIISRVKIPLSVWGDKNVVKR